MSERPDKITREELHRCVWNIPFVGLAKDLGFSYTELVRICEWLKVPRPDGGYWFRRRQGITEEPEPLPLVSDDTPNYFKLRRDDVNIAQLLEQAAKRHELSAARPNLAKHISEAQAVKQEEPPVVNLVPGQPIEITRDDLYRLVWGKPITAVAKALGVYPKHVVEACEQLNVPRPPAGHWNRIQFGIPVEQDPLPEAGPGMPVQTTIGPQPKREKIVTQESEAEEPVTEPTELPIVAEQTAPPVGVEDAHTEPREPETPAVVEYTREQLYDAIWSTPCSKLAASLGISDVALAKTCRRLGVPRPKRGYWARIESGERVPKDKLPAAKTGQDRLITFNVAENLERRQEWATNNVLTSGRSNRPIPLVLSDEGAELHPLAEKHQEALAKAKPNELDLISVRRKELFHCDVSQSMVPRLVRALDALIEELEDRDYEFKVSDNVYCGLKVQREGDQVEIRWSESIVEIEREPTNVDRRKPSWTWQLKEKKPSGALTIELQAYGFRGKRKWTEDEGRSLEEILGIVLEKIEATFRGFEEQRARELDWAKQREEAAKKEAERQVQEAERRAREEEERKEQEKIKRHERKLLKIAEERHKNLAIAAHQWIEGQSVSAFIDSCEARWRQVGEGALSNEQLDWIEWARGEAMKMSPFAKGYPDPSQDGRLDANNIPVGGPYPEVRALKEAEVDKPAQPPEPKTVYVQPPPQEYPFWLLHRNR